jgi:hypothetical protein
MSAPDPPTVNVSVPSKPAYPASPTEPTFRVSHPPGSPRTVKKYAPRSP